MRRASNLFGELRIRDALEIYDDPSGLLGGSCINWSSNIDSSINQIADNYTLDASSSPEKSRLVLAYTNQQVNKLNEAIRSELKKNDRLGHKNSITINNLEYSVKDRIVFLKNDNSEEQR